MYKYVTTSATKIVKKKKFIKYIILWKKNINCPTIYLSYGLFSSFVPWISDQSLIVSKISYNARVHIRQISIIQVYYKFSRIKTLRVPYVRKNNLLRRRGFTSLTYPPVGRIYFIATYTAVKYTCTFELNFYLSTYVGQWCVCDSERLNTYET